MIKLKLSNGVCNSLLSPFGLKNYEGCELVGIALKEHKTPVSKIVSITFILTKKNQRRRQENND